MAEARIAFTNFHVRKGFIEFLCTTYESQQPIQKDTIFFKLMRQSSHEMNS